MSQSQEDLQEEALTALQSLPELERLVIGHYLGLYDRAAKTVPEIAALTKKHDRIVQSILDSAKENLGID